MNREVILLAALGTIATGALGQEIPPELRARFTDKQIETAVYSLLVMPTCLRQVPGFRDKARSAYDGWRLKNKDLVTHLEGTMVLNAPASNESKLDDSARNLCGGLLATMERELRPADERFATPAKTWEEFKSALDRGDQAAAVNCFDSSTSQFAEAIALMPGETLRKMGASFKELLLADSSTGALQEAVVKTADGNAHSVMFVNQDGEWKIAQL
jgi:hypothetical protein